MGLRDYQQAAVDALLKYFQDHPDDRSNPLVAMPTGTGKSWVIAAWLRLVYQWQPDARVFMLTHVKKLIEQNFEKLLTLWPTAPAGIYSAGLKRRELHNKITYAGIASLINVAEQIGKVDLVVVDEAHLVSHKGETMYRDLFDLLYKVNPKMKIIGLSATCYRMGLGPLTEGGIFSDVAFDLTDIRSFNWLIEQGYLAPLHAVSTDYRMDADDVRTSGGEYVQKDLQAKFDHRDINLEVCKEICNIAYGKRQRWKIFASGIEHAEHVADILNGWGIPTVAIHSKLAKDEHDRRFRDYADGRVTCAVSMDELTTGVDIPEMDFIAMLRPTRSTARWVQMLGRGTRPCPEVGKVDCLVADFTNNTRDLGPINDPVLPVAPRERKGKPGAIAAAPCRECPACRSWVHASIGTCPYCGHVFATPSNLQKVASGLEVMKLKEDEPQVEEIRVDAITYNKHTKKGRPNSMVVSYHCVQDGIPRMFREYVCLEHDGMARSFAHRWWQDRCPNIEPPETVQRAIDLSKQLRIPRAIRVWVNKRHPEIISHVYS